MAMPETTVYKDASTILSQNQVRMSRQPLVVKPVPESPFPQSTPHNHLRLRVLRPNCRHIGWSSFCWEFVHITSVTWPPRQGNVHCANCWQRRFCVLPLPSTFMLQKYTFFLKWGWDLKIILEYNGVSAVHSVRYGKNTFFYKNLPVSTKSAIFVGVISS